MYMYIVTDVWCMYVYIVVLINRDLEHEGVAKFDGQLQLLEEVWAVEGGYPQVVPLLFLPDPVEGLLLRVYAEWVARRLQNEKILLLSREVSSFSGRKR